MARTLLLVALLIPAAAGCLKKHALTDTNRPPVPRGSADPGRSDPVPPAVPPGVDPTASLPAPTPLLEPPQPVRDRDVRAAAAADPVDQPPTTSKEKRQERREDRKEKRDPPAAEKPKLPSPFITNPASPEAAPTPAVPPKAERVVDLEMIKKFYALTVERWDKVTDFEARLIKHEVVNGKEMPTEEILYRFRKSPMSVYMKNIGEHGKGREVLYVSKPGAKMHLVTGQGDQALLRPGIYMQLDPESPLVAGKSRQKITEAGFGKGVEQVGKLLALADKGQFDGLRIIGETKRKEYPYPLQGLEISLKPGDDPSLPKGGKREVYVDPKADSPSYGLPVVVRCLDHTGKEIEYYAFDQFKLPANLSDADFSPDRLSKRK